MTRGSFQRRVPGRRDNHAGTAVLVLGTADWISPISTNQHHVTRALVDCFDDITFVESQGLRRPQICRADIKRMFSRLRRRPRVRLSDRPVRVVSPRIPPVSLVPRVIHPVLGALLRKQLREWMAADRRVLWTYTPVTLGLESAADAVVYHCVDLLAHQYRIREQLVITAERNLARRRGCIALASSTVVEDWLNDSGFKQVILLQNVADAELFAATQRERPAGLPRAVFAGRLTESKIDVALLERLSRSEHFELVLAGPEAPDWGGRAFAATVTGNLSPEGLAELLSTASVGLIPYRSTPYTSGVFPLKVYEYLAAGLAVVSTPLPSMTGLDLPDLERATGPEEFCRLVEAKLAWPDDDTVARRRAAAAANSWTRRRDEIRAIARSVKG